MLLDLFVRSIPRVRRKSGGQTGLVVEVTDHPSAALVYWGCTYGTQETTLELLENLEAVTQ